MRSILIMAAVFCNIQLQAQVLQVVDTSHANVSFRGLSVVDEKVIWVSGSKGTIGRSLDAGMSWQWVNPAGYSGRDFRDIEAFDENTAIAMAVDSPGIILKTNDGGKTWRVVYQSDQPGIFLDAMDFEGPEGYCIGDPINGKFWLLQTQDYGEHWTLLPENTRPEALRGEACFAASGTNLIVTRTKDKDKTEARWVTGGSNSRLHVFSNGLVSNYPLWLMQGGQMTGSNSIASMPSGGLVITAGDYLNSKRADSCLVYRQGQQQGFIEQSPIGYTSCVAASYSGDLLICGLNGVAFAAFDGDDEMDAWTGWHTISSLGFHVLQAAPKSKVAFAAGPKGRIAKITW